MSDTALRPVLDTVRTARLTPGVWRATERELMIWRRTWRGTVVTAVIEPVLFLAAMGLGVGDLVDASTGDIDLGGGATVDYLGFVTPGLMVAMAMTAMAGNSLWGLMAGMKWMGQFRSMVHTSITPGDIYGGLIAAAATKTALSASVFLAVAAAFGGVVSPWAVLAVPVAMLTAATTVAVLTAYSSGKEDDYTFPMVMRLGVLPLFFLSGTFFPLEQLPDAVQPAAWISPLFHACEAARQATTGTVDGLFVVHVAVLVAIVATVAPIGVRRFTRRLTP